VELLNVGWFTVAAGICRQGDDLDRRVRFPIPAFLIETDSEKILVDTGLHPAAAESSRIRYGDAQGVRVFELEQDASVADQVDLSTITMVVLTHLHFDHAGGLELVPQSVPIVVQRREWEAAHDAAAIERNFYLTVDYAAVDARRLTLVEGDHDLLGDGSIHLLSTPGHTPGHQSVRVGDRLVLGADVTHFASGLDDHRFPTFADDFEAQRASAERLRELRDGGAMVVPGHDPGHLRRGRLPL
jgi:glyoxylase-like metal-dependent hydrolase (beta-lactamase superfamily II)